MTMTYAQQAAAAQDAAFLPIVTQAMIKVAQDIAAEGSGQPNHAQRDAFAVKCLCSPQVFAPLLAQGVVSDGVTDKNATDVAIYTRISAIWNGYAGV